MAGAAGHMFRRAVFYGFGGYVTHQLLRFPASQGHLTLWLCSSFVLFFGVDVSGSPRELRLTHGACYISAHTLLLAYIITLYFVPGGFAGLDGKCHVEWVRPTPARACRHQHWQCARRPELRVRVLSFRGFARVLMTARWRLSGR